MTPPPRTPIRTARLRLEPAAPRHAVQLHAAIEASRDELRPWMPFAEQQFEGTRQFLIEGRRAWRHDTDFNFVIVEAGVAVGGIGLHRGRIGRGAELGYWVRSDRAGRGYASEAGGALVDFGFDLLGVERLTVVAGTGNAASLRVAAKLGFKFAGHNRLQAARASGELYDCYQFDLLRSDRDRARVAGGVIDAPDFSRGLVTAVVQDADDGTVLMVAHMDHEAYRRTVETRRAWFWSRERAQLWQKGETSGNHLDVDQVTIDCDGDAVLLRVHPHGPACHTGERSCFHHPAR